MAINSATKTLIKSFEQKADEPFALTNLCSTPPENYYKSETIALDSFYENIHIAPVVKSVSETGEKIAIDSFNNSEFKAPVMKQSFDIPAEYTARRSIGQDTFEEVDHMVNLMKSFERHVRAAVTSQRASIELMISQMLQTGAIKMKDPAGFDSYEIDFKQKDTHLDKFKVAWTSSENAKPFSNLNDMANVIITDGRRQPELVIMSEEAYTAMQNTKQYLTMADNRRINIIDPSVSKRMNGMIFKERLNLTSASVDVFVYNGSYDVLGGQSKKFLNSGSVIMMPYDARIDLTFGAIPLIGNEPDSQFSFLRFRTNVMSKMDFSTNIYRSDDRTCLHGFVASRPLPILTAKDQIACGDCGA